LDANLEPRDNTKDSNESQDEHSPRQSPAYTSPSSFYHPKKNLSRSANAFRDRSADNTANNNVEIEEEAPITAAGV